jgi:hypothetical protein
MTEHDPSGQTAADHETAQVAVRRLEDIAARLNANGLPTKLRDTTELLDLTAHVRQSGTREADAIIDPDGYVELRFWISFATTTAQAADIIARALAFVTATD